MILGAGGVIVRSNETLMFRRKNAPIFDRMYANPGGGQEKWESPDQTAVRETQEEIGVKSRVLRQLTEWPYMINGELAGVFTGYLLEILEGEPRIMEDDKAEDLRWFPLDNLPENIAPFTRAYLQVLIDEKKLSNGYRPE